MFSSFFHFGLYSTSRISYIAVPRFFCFYKSTFHGTGEDFSKLTVMVTAAIVIYVILALLFGPLWPLDYIGGKAGCLGIIIFLAWGALFIAGLSS